MTPTTASVEPRSIPLRVYAVIAAGILAISSAAILIKYTQAEGVPSLAIAAIRLTLAALLLTPVVLRRYQIQIYRQSGDEPPLIAFGRPAKESVARVRLRLSDSLLAVASGVFLAIHFATWVTSLEYTSVLISVVFVTTGPIWVALIEVFLLKSPLPRLVGIGLLVAIGGGLIIGFGSAGNVAAGSMEHNVIGGALSLAGAMTFAGYLTIGRRLRASVPVIPYIWMVYGCAGITLMLAVFVTGTPLAGYSLAALILLLALAIFPQLIGHSSMNYAVGYMSATVVSTISQLEPIGSAILALIILNETPLPVQVFGSAVILGGVMLANLGQLNLRQEKKKSS